jgi:hypothetical protein
MKCWGGKGTTLVVDASAASLEAFRRVRPIEEEFTPLGILGPAAMKERQMKSFTGNQNLRRKDCTTRSLSPSQRLALFLVGDEDDWNEDQVPDEDSSTSAEESAVIAFNDTTNQERDPTLVQADEATMFTMNHRLAKKERVSHSIPSRLSKRRQGEPPILLPYSTRHLLCNWSPATNTVIAALLRALQQHWLRAPSQVFWDLGCGDGRIVSEVCCAFEECSGIGVDLNPGLIDAATKRVLKCGVEQRCDFRVGDLSHVDMSGAGAVFLYLPKLSLDFVASKVLPRARLPKGAGIFCATDPLPRCDKLYSPMHYHTEKVSLFCYRWLGETCQSSSMEGGTKTGDQDTDR